MEWVHLFKDIPTLEYELQTDEIEIFISEFADDINGLELIIQDQPWI